MVLSAPEPNEMEAWVQAAYDNSLQVQIAKANWIFAKEVERSRYAHYPTIDAVASANTAVRTTARSASVRTDLR